MAKRKSSTSRAASTVTKTTARTITRSSTGLSAATASTIEEIRNTFKKDRLVQELISGLTQTYALYGLMGTTPFQSSLSSQLHTWPDTYLKKFREFLRRITTALSTPSSNDVQKDSEKPTSIPGKTTYTQAITSYFQGEAPSSRPRTTTASLKKSTHAFSPRLRRNAKRRKKN